MTSIVYRQTQVIKKQQDALKNIDILNTTKTHPTSHGSSNWLTSLRGVNSNIKELYTTYGRPTYVSEELGEVQWKFPTKKIAITIHITDPFDTYGVVELRVKKKKNTRLIISMLNGYINNGPKFITVYGKNSMVFITLITLLLRGGDGYNHINNVNSYAHMTWLNAFTEFLKFTKDHDANGVKCKK